MASQLPMLAQAVADGPWWHPNPWMGWVMLGGLAVGLAWGAWDMWRDR